MLGGKQRSVWSCMAAAVVLDANVILRHVLGDHKELSPKADAILASIMDGSTLAFVPQSVFAECIYVLEGSHYGVPRETVAQRLSRFLGYRGLIGEHLPLLKEAIVDLCELLRQFRGCVCSRDGTTWRL